MKPKGLDAESAAAAMAGNFYCTPEAALISFRQCRHIQAKKPNSCDRCSYRRLEPIKGTVPRDILSALFDLQGLVGRIRLGVQKEFERLAWAMEDCRDCIRDYLDSLHEEERPRVEFLLSAELSRLANETGKLADSARQAGVINGSLAYNIGWLGISLIFISGLTRLIRDFPLQDYL
jgi:DNA-directed RNA polymerase subunit RPC12/RpoP